MARYIDADNLINELSAACMPIYEKGITGILGDNSSIADIINEQPTTCLLYTSPSPRDTR